MGPQHYESLQRGSQQHRWLGPPVARRVLSSTERLGSQQHLIFLKGLSSTGSWGSQQHQNAGVSAAPECGGRSSTLIFQRGISSTTGSQQHWEVGVSATPNFPNGSQQHQNMGVSAAPKGFQQHAGLRVLLPILATIFSESLRTGVLLADWLLAYF